MNTSRAMPILASAAMALSLAACQGMGWNPSGGGQTSSTQSSGTSGTAYPQSSSAQAMSAQQQAVAPAMVRDLQRTLGQRGYDPGQVDGIYGSGTEQALRRFQQDQNLNATGQIDGQTLAALGMGGQQMRQGARAGGPPPAYTPTSQRQGAMAPQSDQVRQVQQSLASQGYDAGPVDGRMGPRTRDALRNFQRDRNIQASGRPDGETLAALGLEEGGPGTQTGQLPEDSGAPRSPDIPQQQSELPPTGSQAPGSAPEASREPGLPGQEVQPPASEPGR